MSAFSKFGSMQKGLSRRTFLAGAAAAAVTACNGAFAQSASVDNIPIINAHIHLFDGTRPLGAGTHGEMAGEPDTAVDRSVLQLKKRARLDPGEKTLDRNRVDDMGFHLHPLKGLRVDPRSA